MINELLLSRKQHNVSLIEQTKTKPQETLQFKMNKQMQTYSFNPPISLSEEKWLLARTIFEATSSVFNITNGNSRFSNSIPRHGNSEDGEELFNKLTKLVELRSQNDMKLHVKEVEKRGTRIEAKNWL